MNANNTDFADAIRSLATEDFEHTLRCAIDKVVSSGAALELVQAEIARARRAGDGEQHAVRRLMGSLEALAEISPVSARVLMAVLWPIAGRLLLHDICDAIDLWIVNEMSDDLRHQLRQVLESERDDGSRRHLNQLLQNHG